MRNDIITRIETTLTPDGQGGWTEETVETGEQYSDDARRYSLD